MTSTIAVLGTGTMGAPMAHNLAAAGFNVRAWNRSRDKAEPLARDGITIGGSPAGAAAGADVLITMLFDVAAVREVAPAALGALADGALWLQMSTVGVAGTRELAALAESHGVDFVDAPVLGTRTPAENGTLVVLASGDQSLRERCAPVFDAVGSRTLWIEGGAGASGLSLINTLRATALDKGLRPVLARGSGGLSGPALKPIALHAVSVCHEATGLPIVGMGGIESGRDALEFAACGAHDVALGTVLFGDPGAPARVRAELATACADAGVAKPEDAGSLAKSPETVRKVPA
jgi:3-hydroxyisobutyrate dehydrogenase